MLTDDMIIKVPLDSRVHGGVGRAPPTPRPSSPPQGHSEGRALGWRPRSHLRKRDRCRGGHLPSRDSPWQEGQRLPPTSPRLVYCGCSPGLHARPEEGASTRGLTRPQVRLTQVVAGWLGVPSPVSRRAPSRPAGSRRQLRGSRSEGADGNTGWALLPLYSSGPRATFSR